MPVAIPLEQMSVEEKLAAIETIWADLSRAPEAVPSPAWHGDALRAREKSAAEGRSRFLGLAEAKKALRERLR